MTFKAKIFYFRHILVRIFLATFFAGKISGDGFCHKRLSCLGKHDTSGFLSKQNKTIKANLNFSHLLCCLLPRLRASVAYSRDWESLRSKQQRRRLNIQAKSKHPIFLDSWLFKDQADTYPVSSVYQISFHRSGKIWWTGGRRFPSSQWTELHTCMYIVLNTNNNYL